MRTSDNATLRAGMTSLVGDELKYRLRAATFSKLAAVYVFYVYIFLSAISLQLPCQVAITQFPSLCVQMGWEYQGLFLSLLQDRKDIHIDERRRVTPT